MKRTTWYIDFGESTIEIGSEEAEEREEALGEETDASP